MHPATNDATSRSGGAGDFPQTTIIVLVHVYGNKTKVGTCESLGIKVTVLNDKYFVKFFIKILDISLFVVVICFHANFSSVAYMRRYGMVDCRWPSARVAEAARRMPRMYRITTRVSRARKCAQVCKKGPSSVARHRRNVMTFGLVKEQYELYGTN